MNVAAFHRHLRAWYVKHGRKDLPWRNTDDAYAIYVSEIMLQQTQVKTVRERYYSPFLRRFPTIASLAKAKREEVLKAWQGLGYYSRAIHLHEAAKQCRRELPKTVDGLMALPGVGRNTAQAIAAFAHRQPVPVMEANVKRVISRIFALTRPNAAELWEKADALLDARHPFDYNQAMMDIGAMVCTRRAPKCGICPAAAICKGKSTPESYPAAMKKAAVPVRKKYIVVRQNAKGEYYAAPRKTRFLHGLYHFIEQDKPPTRMKHLGHIRQSYSHFTLEADVYLAKAKGGGKYWHGTVKLKKLPFSMAEHKILRLLA